MSALPDAYVQKLTELAVSEDAIRNGKCFMCGGTASSGQGEHVFPLWLQHKFSLLDEELTLLNGTMIPYRQLTTPCCRSCNTGPLSKLEKRVQSSFENRQIEDLNFRAPLGQWLFKILLGIIHAECRLRLDRSEPSFGSIFPPEAVDELFCIHLLVNSCRKLTAYACLHGELPFTLYMYRIVASRHFSQFDFSTNLPGRSVAIRMGDIGAIAVADGGMQNEIGAHGPFGLAGHKLHPLQFSEIVTRIHYKALLRDATHLYLNNETPDHLLIEQVQVQPFSDVRLEDGSLRIFREWDDVELAQMLPHYTNFDIDWYDVNQRQARTSAILSDGTPNSNFELIDDDLDKLVNTKVDD